MEKQTTQHGNLASTMLRTVMSPKELWLLVGFAGALCLGGASLYAHHRANGGDPPVVEATAPAAPEEIETVPLPIIEPANAATAPPVPSDPPAATLVAVSVVGAVSAPGVYRLPEDARVKDLVDAAGGPCEDADLSDINLAARLIDGSTLNVPARAAAHREGNRLVLRRPESARVLNPPQYTISGWRAAETVPAPVQGSGVPDTTAEESSSGLLDLNRASAEELESLPGIGPKLSAEIIGYRDYAPFQTVDDVMNVPGIGPKRLEAIRPLVTVEGL